MASPSDAAHQKALEDIKRFREDVILDFAAFESSIARIQFLRASNEKERQRYADEKVKIENTAQAVRENTARLRVQLDEAQRTLAIRKTYDVLADQITGDRALKPRDEQYGNIEKLRTEIEDLEREGRENSQSWVERREQFGRMVNEGMRLRRLVRDEKEPESESRDEGQDMLDVGESSREPVSNMGTPRPDPGGLTPRPAEQDSGDRTPGQRGREGEMAEDQAANAHEGAADADMADDGEVADATPLEKPVDQMDTS